MGKISKTFKRVVLSAIAVVGLGGVFFGTTLASFKDQQPVVAVEENESKIYDFSYSNNELKLLFNANLSAYKGLNKSVVRQMKDDLLSLAKSVLSDDIKLESTSAPEDPGEAGAPLRLSRVLKLNGARTGVDTTTLENLILTQLGDSPEKLEQFLLDSQSGTAYDTLTQFYIDRFATNYALQSGKSVADVKTDIQENILSVVNAKIDEIYAADAEAAEAAKAAAETNITTSVESSNDATIDVKQAAEVISIISEVVNAEVEGVDSVSVEDIMNDFKDGEGNVTVKEEIVEALTNPEQENYVDEVVDLLKNVDSSVVSSVIENVGFTSDDMIQVIENVGTSKLIEIANEIDTDSLKEILNAANVDKDALIDTIKNSITVRDVIKAVNRVTIGEEVLFDRDNGGLRGRGFINLLKTLPRPSEIRNWTSDEQARLYYNIVVETSLGTVDFKLTVGLFGNVSFIAELAGIVDDAFAVSYTDGTLNVVVKAPQAVSSLVKRICESTAISDDLKHFAYDLIFSTVEDAYATIRGTSLEEYIELLKGVDYSAFIDRALSADSWNNALNTNKFTNERIDKLVDYAARAISFAASKDYETFKALAEKVYPSFDDKDDKLEKAFNKIQSLLERIDAKDITAQKLRDLDNETVYDLLDRLAAHEDLFNRGMGVLDRLYDAIPDSFKGKSIMDFYVNEDGVRSFQVENEFSLNIEKVIKALTPTYGERIVNALSRVLDKVPDSITINFEAKFSGLYKITYHIGDTEKVGLLPEGADVAFFANAEEFEGAKIVKWVYADGSEVEGMPTDDVEVYAVFDFEVDEIADVEKVFLEEASVEATTNPEELQWDVKYQWYKVNGDTEVALEFQSGQELNLNGFTVADSGEYFVRVSELSPDGTGVVLERDSAKFKVTVTKKDVEDPVLDPADPFTYDGTEKEVALDPESELYSISGNKGTKAGSYTAKVTLADKDNYQWKSTGKSDDLELKWSINPAKVDKPAKDETKYVYNHGANITYVVAANDLYTVSGNVQKDAGTYTVTIKLKDSANYTWADGTTADLKYEFVIAPYGVAKPAVGTNKFTYDGTEKTYVLTSADSAYFEVEGNKATNAGEYEATVRLINKNYVWKDTDGDKAPLSYNWTIDPKKVAKPAATGTSYAYTGSEIKYQFAGADYVTIFGDKATEPGEYVAVIMLKNGNFVWEDGTEDPISVKWTITKAVIDVPAIAWNYTAPFNYDGQEKEVKLSTQLGNNIVVTYEGNKATEAGDYVAKATLAPADPAHYQIDPSKTTYTLQWKIVGSGDITEVFNLDSFEKDAQGNPYANVKVNGQTGIRSDYTLHSPAMSENDDFWKNVDFDAFFDKTEKNGGYIVHCAYDIHFEDAQNATQAVSGQFTVKMLVPEDLRGNNNLIVLHIADDGTIEELQAERNGIYMEFNTTHFSVYAIAERTAAPNVPIWPFIVIIALLVVIIILQVIILLRKKAAAAAPAEEEKPEEPKEEEQPKEEPQPEPQPEPEPEPEEEPEEEEELEEEEEEEEPAVEGQPVLKKKRKKMVHFQTKLARSEKDLRHKYYDLRDYIKSYGINNRISIPCDTFSLHRKRYVVVTIAGKRLKIYLACEPSKYELSPIPVEPTRLKKYEDLPTMFKVKSDLSVKRAKLMIDEMMAAEGYERKE